MINLSRIIVAFEKKIVNMIPYIARREMAVKRDCIFINPFSPRILSIKTRFE
ncbi:MAG: hypothetical protein WH035_01170 [Spirochaetota bacterium]